MQRIVLFAFLFIGITLAATAAPAEVETLTIAMDSDNYVPATAHVTQRYTRKHPKGPPTEVVEFEYTVDGKTYHGDNKLTWLGDSKSDIDGQIQYRGGEKYMQVFYDPEQPRHVLIHKDIGVLMPIGILGVTAFCLYGSISGFIEDRKARKKERRESDAAEAV